MSWLGQITSIARLRGRRSAGVMRLMRDFREVLVTALGRVGILAVEADYLYAVYATFFLLSNFQVLDAMF